MASACRAPAGKLLTALVVADRTSEASSSDDMLLFWVQVCVCFICEQSVVIWRLEASRSPNVKRRVDV